MLYASKNAACNAIKHTRKEAQRFLNIIAKKEKQRRKNEREKKGATDCNLNSSFFSLQVDGSNYHGMLSCLY